MTQDNSQPLRLNYVILLLLDNRAQPPTYRELEKQLAARRWMGAETTLSPFDTLEWLLDTGYISGALPNSPHDQGMPFSLTECGRTELEKPSRPFLSFTPDKNGQKRPLTQRLILECLAEEGSMGALQLVRSISIRTHEHMRPTAGSLYPPLHRLGKDNLIASATRRLPQGGTYTYYSLTDIGFAALAEPEKPWHHPLSRHLRRML